MMLAALLLTACSDDSDGTSSSQDGDCYIEVYVYQPDRPMLIRAVSEPVIDPTEGESTIHELKIWVFRHSDGQKVGYLEVGESTEKPLFDILNENGQQLFKIKVDAAFADNPENVDVYVVANGGNDASTLGETTARAALKAAVLGSSSFGVNDNYTHDAVVKEVPETGLPMSAQLEDQSIYGSFPTLRIGNATTISTLRLTRAVSKLRFVICRKTEEDNAKQMLESITSVKLNGSMIPTQTFLLPVSTSSYASVLYDGTEMDYRGIEKDDIPEVDDPMDYAYTTQTPEEYEELVKEAVTSEKLYQFGLTYLRESPKQLTGTITYTVKERNDTGTPWDNVVETANFSMAAPGEFMRNHSWIIYIYYMDAKIHTLTVTHLGMRDWVDYGGGSLDHNVYNW